jgi:hypothetical protein
VHDDARRLVDDEQVLVLIWNAQLLRLGLERAVRLLDRCDLDQLTGREPVAFRLRLAVDPDPPADDQTLGFGTRGDLRQRCDEPVEPLPRRGFRNTNPDAQWRVSPSTIAAKRMPTPTTMNVSARLKAGQ